jgi:hypothetical protein
MHRVQPQWTCASHLSQLARLLTCRPSHSVLSLWHPTGHALKAIRHSVLSTMSTFIGRTRKKWHAWQGCPVRSGAATHRPKRLILDGFSSKRLLEWLIARGNDGRRECFSTRTCLFAWFCPVMLNASVKADPQATRRRHYVRRSDTAEICNHAVSVYLSQSAQ